MSKVFLIDLNKCNGCYNCQIVCKDEHCGTSWLPYTAEQPETGQFWMRLVEKTRGQVPWVRVSYTPTLCAHCAEAACIAAGRGAVYRRDDGLIIIDPETAKGNKALVDSCPLGAIFYNDELDVAQKCTGCAHLLDNGWDVPRCVDACAHDAILYKEEAEFGELLSKAEFLKPVADLGPKTYYLNLPKRFAAGTAVDFAADEVLIGATVALKNADGVVATQITDDLGDFKFDQVASDTYTVVISAEGYIPTKAVADLTERDLSLGDLGLIRA
ncbi:MAG: carboxypeptidase regulatory-like domain-containing protein [Coriobacteriales bacterium]|nr:carboxypeptidase regulatory-like domain-containing protein [Coriobacteriales bacterium]